MNSGGASAPSLPLSTAYDMKSVEGLIDRRFLKRILLDCGICKIFMPQKFVHSYTVDITIATCIDSVDAQIMFKFIQCSYYVWLVHEGLILRGNTLNMYVHAQVYICVHVSLSMPVFNSKDQ